MRNLPSLLRSLHLASVGLTIPRARSFTVCEMSGRSCDRYAARITHDRYVFARSFPLIPASAGPPTSSHRVCPLLLLFHAVSRPNSGIKRSTCLLSGSKKTACRPLCFPTLVRQFRNGFLGRHLPRTLKCRAVSARMHSRNRSWISCSPWLSLNTRKSSPCTTILVPSLSGWNTLAFEWPRFMLPDSSKLV